MDFALSALRGRLRLPCLRAEIGPARKINLACGQRAGLYGLDALPVTSALGGRCPGGPSLRSGKPWGPAHGQVRADLKVSANAARHHALPECPRGRGCTPPNFTTAAWGRSRLGARGSSAPPMSPARRGRLAATTAGRRRVPSGASAPGGAARLVARFSGALSLCRASPRRATGSSPRPGQALDPGAALRHEKAPPWRDFVTINARGIVTKSWSRHVPILFMRDLHDPHTLDLLAVPTGPARRGRPPKQAPLSDAERARRYRERKRQRLADLRDPEKPVSSSIIDLSEVTPWRRS